jgi:alpha-tubulin suppressor-like RCC1 family protein
MEYRFSTRHHVAPSLVKRRINLPHKKYVPIFGEYDAKDRERLRTAESQMWLALPAATLAQVKKHHAIGNGLYAMFKEEEKKKYPHVRRPQKALARATSTPSSSQGRRPLSGGSNHRAGQVDSIPVISVVTGSAHTMVLVPGGQVFSFGKGVCGRLGHGDEFTRFLPRPIQALATCQVVTLAAGGAFSMCVTADKKLFTWGKGDYGQLGHQDFEDQKIPRIVSKLRKIRAELDEDGCEFFVHIGVVDCSAGDAHSLIITDTGLLMSFGKGQYGRNGHGAHGRIGSRDLDHPVRVTIPDMLRYGREDKIVQIAAGGAHSLAVGNGGQLYSFGLGTDGQLGLGDNRSAADASRVNLLLTKQVAQCSAGSFHSLVVTAEGDLYSFGRGRGGRLGQGSYMELQNWVCDDSVLPKLVQLERWVHVRGRDMTEKVQISTTAGVHAGHAHSMIVSDQGEMWTCGIADDYRLGSGENNGDQFRFQQCLPFCREKVMSASASYLHSCAVTPDGRLFTWGAVKDGRGGIGRMASHAQLPQQITIAFEDGM